MSLCSDRIEKWTQCIFQTVKHDFLNHAALNVTWVMCSFLLVSFRPTIDLPKVSSYLTSEISEDDEESALIMNIHQAFAVGVRTRAERDKYGSLVRA